MKVFDIVRVMTNGDYRTQVIANQMFEAGIFNNNSGLGATLATLLFVAVLPVMYINIRRMQKAKG
jgi:alpha-glucoside transport system permease protein